MRPDVKLEFYAKNVAAEIAQEFERSCFFRLCGAADCPPAGCAARDLFSSATISSGALADLPSVASALAAAAPAFLAAGSTSAPSPSRTKVRRLFILSQSMHTKSPRFTWSVARRFARG